MWLVVHRVNGQQVSTSCKGHGKEWVKKGFSWERTTDAIGEQTLPRIASRRVCFYNLYGGQFGNIHQNYNMLIPFDPEVPLEGTILRIHLHIRVK